MPEDPIRSQRRFFCVMLAPIGALLLGGLAGCGAAPSRADAEPPSRALDTQLREIDPEAATLISRASIAELHAALASGRLSSQALTRHFLERIEARNPELHAVIAVNPGAMADARSLDAELEQGRSRGALHGIPILIKDNIETRELPTTAGSLALEGNQTGRDAHVVRRLRDAGAIVLGKTNLSEWANFRSERSSSGWSAVGGQARNPHDVSRSACGSSSGSAIAVAAGMAVAALGTETDGSVVCPASVTGIVGIKPTVGLVSSAGIVPISHSQDTAGPMARSVADAALLLAAMVDPESNVRGRVGISDARAWIGNSELERDYVSALDANALRGARIGVLRLDEPYHEAVDALLGRAIATLKEAGATLVDGLRLNSYAGFDDDSYDVLLYEFKHDLNAYLAGLPNRFNSLDLEQLIRFNEKHAAREMAYFQQEIFLKSQAKGDLGDEGYSSALSRIRQATQNDGIDRLLREGQLDALIAPTSDPAWTIDLVNGDPWLDGFSTYPAVAGYPHVTVPMGTVHGLPVGLSFTASALSERKLIGMAFAFESRVETPVRMAVSGGADARQDDAPTELAPPANSSDEKRATPMTITSTAFEHGAAIPSRYTCDGADVSPPLAWSGIPTAAKSLALIVSDPDAPDPAAPKRTWVHWVLYDIPPAAAALREAVEPAQLPRGTRAGSNDWARDTYGGPCPPIGRHRYFFVLYALDTRLGEFGEFGEFGELDAPTRAALLDAMQGHVLAKAELIGTYQRR